MTRDVSHDERTPEMIRADIDQNRADMARTVDEIEHRLSPAHIKEQVADLKEAVVDQVADLKDSVVDQFHEAKEQIKKDLQGDFAQAKTAVRGELHEAKTAAYDATVGRVNHMVDDARETMSEAGSTLLGTIKANPIPSALVAVGVGWLVMGARSTRSNAKRFAVESPYGREDLDLYAGYVGVEPEGVRTTVGGRSGVVERGQRVLEKGQHAAADVRHRVSETGHRVIDRVGATGQRVSDRASAVAHDARDAAHRAGDKASHLAHDVRDQALHVMHDARDTGRKVVKGAGEQYHRVEQTAEVAYTDNPLVFGAVALACGAAVGLALPRTTREDMWLGPLKSRLIEEAQLRATEAIHAVEESVGQIAIEGAPTPRMHDQGPPERITVERTSPTRA